MSKARRTESQTLPDAQASRPTSSPLVGKHDVVVKALVTDEIADDLRAAARRHGYGSVSDCLRELLMVWLYGEEHLASLHANRIANLARNVARKGT